MGCMIRRHSNTEYLAGRAQEHGGGGGGGGGATEWYGIGLLCYSISSILLPLISVPRELDLILIHGRLHRWDQNRTHGPQLYPEQPYYMNSGISSATDSIELVTSVSRCQAHIVAGLRGWDGGRIKVAVSRSSAGGARRRSRTSILRWRWWGKL